MTTPSSRVLPPLAALALAAALTALLLGGLAAPSVARAQVDPAAADGLGSIAGTVVDANGTPLAGMQVDFYAFFDPAYRPGEWSSVKAVGTDGDGRYATALTPGIYRVRFSDPAAVYGLQFYSGAVAVDRAKDVVVAGNAVTGVGARLQVGGSITGTQSYPGYMAADDIAAYTFTGGTWQEVRRGITDTPTGYRLPGLPPGTYHVCVRRDVSVPYDTASPCYDHISGVVAYATDVVVGAGDVISGIDLVGKDFVNYATISGTVTNEGNTPLAGIQVTAWRLGTYFTVTTTDAAGTYRLPILAQGEIQIQFSNPDGLYQDRWFDGSSTASDATDLELVPYEVRGDVNAVLAIGGRITGTWSSLGSYPTVFALAVPSGNIVGKTAYRLTPGYQLGGLPPGVYHVCEQHQVPYSTYTYVCYPDDAPFSMAANITVDAGSTVANINRSDKLPLTGGAVLTGTVVGPNQQPLPGIYVDLLRWLAPGSLGPPEVFADKATIATGANGAYRFEGVEDGSYSLRAYDPGGVYASTAYTTTPWFNWNRTFEVKDGAGPVLDAIQMPVGGAVSGVVRSASGYPISNATVSILKFDEPGIRMDEEWHVDALGRFRAARLWPGRYLVCADTNSLPLFIHNCYGVTPGFQWHSDAQPVTVTAGAETGGVVITMGPTPVTPIFLPQIDR